MESNLIEEIPALPEEFAAPVPVLEVPEVVEQPAAAVANPTPSVPEKTQPSWERAWSLVELRDGVSNWNLASDAGLYNYLQEFSSRIISRTKEVGVHVEELIYETKKADVRVHNAFNAFLLLSNVQFVENRVYDEDESVVQEQPKDETKQQQATEELTKEQREAILVPKYTSAINHGMEALKKATLDDQPAPEGAPPAEEIAQKDVYGKFHLPYIIGTKEFNDDEFCGLKFSESEEEEEETDETDDEETDDEETDEDKDDDEKKENTGALKDGEEPKKIKDDDDSSEYETDDEPEPTDMKSQLEKSLRAQLDGQLEPPVPGEKRRRKKKKKQLEILQMNQVQQLQHIRFLHLKRTTEIYLVLIVL